MVGVAAPVLFIYFLMSASCPWQPLSLVLVSIQQHSVALSHHPPSPRPRPLTLMPQAAAISRGSSWWWTGATACWSRQADTGALNKVLRYNTWRTYYIHKLHRESGIRKIYTSFSHPHTLAHNAVSASQPRVQFLHGEARPAPALAPFTLALILALHNERLGPHRRPTPLFPLALPAPGRRGGSGAAAR